MMMSLGMFVFSLPTLTYQGLARKNGWRWEDSQRVGAIAASQYVGPGPETISLSGNLAPEVAGDVASIAELRKMGDRGEAWPLVNGLGDVLGQFVIEDLDEKQGGFFSDGVARRYDFTLNLKRVPDQEPAPAGGAPSG